MQTAGDSGCVAPHEMLNASGIGDDEVAYGSWHQVEPVEPDQRGRCLAKFEVGIAILHPMDDFRFVKRKWLQQLRLVIDANFVNTSSGKFEEIFDDEA